jgi:hypothetical protein
MMFGELRMLGGYEWLIIAAFFVLVATALRFGLRRHTGPLLTFVRVVQWIAIFSVAALIVCAIVVSYKSR